MYGGNNEDSWLVRVYFPPAFLRSMMFYKHVVALALFLHSTRGVICIQHIYVKYSFALVSSLFYFIPLFFFRLCVSVISMHIIHLPFFLPLTHVCECLIGGLCFPLFGEIFLLKPSKRKSNCSRVGACRQTSYFTPKGNFNEFENWC